MKKVLLVLVIVMAIIVCGATKVKIGVTPIPFVYIHEFIKP